MKASQLIKKIEDQIDKQGDVEVIIYPKLKNFDVYNGDTDYSPDLFNGVENHIYKNHIVIDEII